MSKNNHSDSSGSGRFEAQFVTQDDSVAALLLNSGIEVRDFILLSFLAGQGPMTVLQLARTISIEPDHVRRSLGRLSSPSAALVHPELCSAGSDGNQTYTATARGQEISNRVNGMPDNT